MNDLVSVIVPVHNSEKYLEQCINSIRVQDYENIEVILINDGSKDNSLSICQSLSAIDKRISVISQKNQGVSSARNTGLCCAKGKYICFVDSDDIVLKGYVSAMVTEMVKQEVDVVYDTHSYVYNERILKRNSRFKSGIYTRKQILHLLIDDGTLTGILFGSVCGALYSSDLIRKNNIQFDEDLCLNEDGIFNIEVAMHIKSISIIEKGNYLYRQDAKRKEKISVNGLKQREDALKKSNIAISSIIGVEEIHNYEIQMKRRKVSIGFWHILWLCEAKMPVKQCYCYVKKTVEAIDITLDEFQQSKILFIKKVILILMCKQMYLTLLILLKYFYPLGKRFIKR